ncbi:hypothetical protein D0X99_10895 [Algoriphagus lacus]|uniref:Uncharacterized protein n=1 Tax=Algoriphagus lacus TaxID=2056311 RepID=A0A418PSL6_9BACT|nr:hypothetical protein [Algoriphagus lacus]RIW15917.1 hypothetical protein D0X99_10895 [Algoriphagus lacus]
MNLQDSSQVTQVITAWGPFLASLITGFVVYLAARIQGKSTLNAAKEQSNATIETMKRSLDSQFQLKKQENFQSAITDLILNLYLIERNPNYYILDEKPILYSMARLNTHLGSSLEEKNLRKLIGLLRFELINKGDTSNIPSYREQIEEILTSINNQVN